MRFDSANALRLVPGLKTQKAAMQACGMQPEFASQLMLQCNALGVNVILRAGCPPIYNQERSPKSSATKSKTSNQGFFKGSIAENILFTRVNYRADINRYEAIGHHPKDTASLKLSPSEKEYQHRVPLKITIMDLLQELSLSGDLEIAHYESENSQLFLRYKENKGDYRFKGNFVLKLKEKIPAPLPFYSRPWDRPENHPDWAPELQIIKKPPALACFSDEEYQEMFHHFFYVFYTDEPYDPSTEITLLNQANVFASKPESASEFLAAMGKNHPKYQQIESLKTIKDILKQLSEEEILEIYNKKPLIITGDWDGLLLGHPPAINTSFKKIHNTLFTLNSYEEIVNLLNSTTDYFLLLKQQAKRKKVEEQNEMDKLILSISDPNILISDYSLEHAGCISAHEFLFQQLLNYNYRSKTSNYYGDKDLFSAMQEALNEGLEQSGNDNIINIKDRCDWVIQNFHDKIANKKPNAVVLATWDDHLSKHFQKAASEDTNPYLIPHPHYDHNIHDLFQHGFEMNNPFGCNLEGAWIMISSDGGVIYGETQEQLIQLLLVEGFLEINLFAVNPEANMACGWAKVIERQLELGQYVPESTKAKLTQFKLEGKDEHNPEQKKENLIEKTLGKLHFFRKKSHEEISEKKSKHNLSKSN